MYNKVILAGNLTREVEFKTTSSGLAISSTAIATNRKFKSLTGEYKEEVLFIDITFFGKIAEIANQYLHKGSKVLIEGKLKLDQWTDTLGHKRSKHSLIVENVQMLDSKNSKDKDIHIDSTYTKQEDSSKFSSEKPKNTEEYELEFEEKDIPF